MTAQRWTRRDFLKFSATAAAAGIVAPRALLSETEPAQAGVELEYRVLGRTGLRITAVSLGCMVAPEEVIAKALDMGINFFDTAHSYKTGRNEWEVGRVLKGKRDKAYICTKMAKRSTDAMLKELDTSLKRLQTDHVDLLLTHGATNGADVTNEAYIAALQKAKEQGKTRFIGLSTHISVAECIEAAVEAKIYDAVLTKYNFSSEQAVTNAIAKAKAAGVGIIAMKTQNGGDLPKTLPFPTGGLTRHQAALRWALDDENVSCAIPGCRSLKHLEENFAVMGKRLGYLDRRRLERHAIATAGVYCTGCGECDGTCPMGVEIPEVRRCYMYLDGYQDPALASENYRTVAVNAASCTDCETCTARCVYGTPLQPVLRETHRRLA